MNKKLILMSTLVIVHNAYAMLGGDNYPCDNFDLGASNIRETEAYITKGNLDQPIIDGYYAGELPLTRAVGYLEGGKDSITKLIKAGANPNNHNAKGKTALIIGIQNGVIDNVKALLRYNADPNLADKEGRLPLQEAILASHWLSIVNKKAIVQELLKHGATRDLLSDEDRTKLDLILSPTDVE